MTSQYSNNRIGVLAILEDALALIEDEDMFVATGNARTAEGEHCCPTSDEAETFSVVGAIIRTGEKLGADGATTAHAIRMVQGGIGPGFYTSIPAYCEKHGHAGAIELMEKAIKVYK